MKIFVALSISAKYVNIKGLQQNLFNHKIYSLCFILIIVLEIYFNSKHIQRHFKKDN